MLKFLKVSSTNFFKYPRINAPEFTVQLDLVPKIGSHIMNSHIKRPRMTVN